MQVLQDGEDHARSAVGAPGSAELLHGKPDSGGCRRVASLCCHPVSQEAACVTHRGMF